MASVINFKKLKLLAFWSDLSSFSSSIFCVILASKRSSDCFVRSYLSFCWFKSLKNIKASVFGRSHYIVYSI